MSDGLASRGQIRAVARQELKFVLRQRLGLIVFGLLMISALVAMLNGWHHFQLESQQQHNLQSLVDQHWQDQPDRHPHRVAHFGTFVFRAPSTLGFFDQGVDRYVGNGQFLEAHRQNPANFAPASYATTLARFGEISPAYLLQTLLPLVILLFAGVCITREREQATANALFAQGLTLRQLVLGKAAAYAVLGGAVVLLLILLTMPLVFWAGAGLTPALLVALAGLAGTYLMYVLLCVLVATAVSAVCADSRQALLLLAGLWLVMVIVTPRVLPFWLQSADAPESRIRFDAAVHAELEQVGDSHNASDDRFETFRQGLLDQYGVDRVEDLPVNFGGLVMQEGERRGSEVFARHYAALQERRDILETRMTAASVINPVIAVKQLSAILSRTDRAAFVHFEMQAEAYRYDFIQQLNHIHTHEIAYENDRGQRVSHTHWQSIAPFEYVPEQWQSLLQRATFPLGVLVVWCTLLMLACRFGLGRRS